MPSQYVVSYAVMDTETGASPFGHAVILFLERKDSNVAWKLDGAYGAYSQPTTTTNIVHKAIKNVLGIKYDLQDTHMELKKEERRYLNLGPLKAKHFPVREEEYKQYKQYISDQIEKEQAAIKDLNQWLEENQLPKDGHQRYKREVELYPKKSSRRLQPFHIDSKLSFDGSHTCKHWALQFLSDNGLISDDQKDPFIGSLKTTIGSTRPVDHAFDPAPLLFASINGSTPFKKKNGSFVPSYDWDHSDFQTVLPIVAEKFPEELIQLLPQINGQLKKLKKIEEEIHSLDVNDPESDLTKCHIKAIALTKDHTHFSNPQLLADLQQTIETLSEQTQTLINIYSCVKMPQELQESLLLRLYYCQAMRQLALGLLVLGVSVAIAACFTGIPAIIAASACVLTSLYIIHRLYQAITEEQQFQVCSEHQYRDSFFKSSNAYAATTIVQDAAQLSLQ